MDTIAVTGGNGTIGGAILEEVNERGYRSVDLARGKRREDVSDRYITTDLLDPGEVYGSLAASDADAVVHMGTIPGPGSNPGYVTYRSNVMSSYHVLEAATELDLEAACLASSINAVGYDYQPQHVEVDYLPVDESHRVTPRDPYGIGKHALEVTADGFGRLDRAPEPLGSLRYPRVVDTDTLRSAYAEADRTLEDFRDTWDEAINDLFTYVHLEDAATIAVDVLEADFGGHETFWAVAEDTITDVPTTDLIDEFYPDVDLRRDVDDDESLISIEKARDLLGWTPEHSWRDL